MSSVKKADLPAYFFIKCDGHGHSGVVYGQILPHENHSLGGRYVAFTLSGYRVADGETVEIQKKLGIFGTKLVLVKQISKDKWKDYSVSLFDVR